jgi:hypothetical protein
MAKAVRNTSTDDEIWFNEVVKLLADSCGSIPFAEQLLIEGLKRGVPWSHMRKDGTRVKGNSVFWDCKTHPLHVIREENRAYYGVLIAADDLSSVPDGVFAIKVSRSAALALVFPPPPKHSRNRKSRKSRRSRQKEKGESALFRFTTVRQSAPLARKHVRLASINIGHGSSTVFASCANSSISRRRKATARWGASSAISTTLRSVSRHKAQFELCSA